MEATKDLIFRAGDILFETDKPLPVTYFILEGSVDLELCLGDKRLSYDMGPNQFIGDAGAAVEQKNDVSTLSYQARAVARDDVKAMAIPIDEIRQELEACSPLLKAWFASFVSRALMVIDDLATK